MATIKLTVRDAFGHTPQWHVPDTATLHTEKHDPIAASVIQVGDVLCFDHARKVCSVEVTAVEAL